MDISRRRVPYSLVLGLLWAVTTFASEIDEVAIREVQTQQAAAWNAHDAVAYANLGHVAVAGVVAADRSACYRAFSIHASMRCSSRSSGNAPAPSSSS